MVPITYLDIPDCEKIDIYVDGGLLVGKAFSENGKVYVPFNWVASRLMSTCFNQNAMHWPNINGKDLFVFSPELQLIFVVTQDGIYKIGAIEFQLFIMYLKKLGRDRINEIDIPCKNKLDYSVISKNGICYIESAFFRLELRVATAWEEDTNTLYLSTVLNYDGYVLLPKEIFSKQVDWCKESFLFIDGVLASAGDQLGNMVVGGYSFSIITDYQEPMMFLVPHPEQYQGHIKVGDKRRFCFKMGEAAMGGSIQTGTLMEIATINNDQRLENMIFSDLSWSEIKKLDNRRFLTERRVTNPNELSVMLIDLNIKPELILVKDIELNDCPEEIRRCVTKKIVDSSPKGTVIMDFACAGMIIDEPQNSYIGYHKGDIIPIFAFPTNNGNFAPVTVKREVWLNL